SENHRMGFGVAPIDVRLENSERQLQIAVVGGVARESKSNARSFLVVLGYALIGNPRFSTPSRLVGEQSAMVAELVLGPLGLIGRFERAQRVLGFILRLQDPSARQRIDQLTDCCGSGRLKMLLGSAITLRSEVSETHQRMRNAVRRCTVQDVARQSLGAR